MKLTSDFNRSLGHLCGEITHQLACKCYLKIHKFMSHDSTFIKRFMLNIEQLVPKNYFNWSLLQTVMQLSRNTIILLVTAPHRDPPGPSPPPCLTTLILG